MTIVFASNNHNRFVLSTEGYCHEFVDWCKSFSYDQRDYDPVAKSWSFEETIPDFMVLLTIQCDMEKWSLVLSDNIYPYSYIKLGSFMESRYLRVLNPIPRSVYDNFMSGVDIPLIRYYDLSTRLNEIKKCGWKIYTNDVARFIIENNQKLNREKVEFGLTKKLYPFQEFDAKFLVNGGLEASQAGLGKSIIILAVLSRHFINGAIKKILLVCLKSTIHNWAEKIEEFCPHLRYVIIEGTPKQRQKLWKQDTDIHIINFELVRSDIKVQRKIQRWNGVVVDECQRIKDWDSKQAKAIKSIKVAYRWGISATPMENKPSDIYSIMSWVKPDLFGRYEHFRTRYLIEEGKFRKVVGYRNMSELSARLSGIMVRQLGDEVSNELPTIVEDVIYVEPSSDQIQYTRFIKDLLRSGQVTTIRTPTAFRQVALDPFLLWESSGEIGIMVRDRLNKPSHKNSPKTVEIVQRCLSVSEEGLKVIVFTKYVRYIKRLATALKNAKIRFVEYHGDDVNIDNEVIGDVGRSILLEMGQGRRTSLQIFYKDPTVVVILCSKAGAVGLDGLQNVSSYVIHSDQEWTESGNDQRTGRLRRFGQTAKVVISTTFITRGTYDERVDMIVRKKGELFDKIMEGSTEIEMNKIMIEDWLGDKQ